MTTARYTFTLEAEENNGLTFFNILTRNTGETFEMMLHRKVPNPDKYLNYYSNLNFI